MTHGSLFSGIGGFDLAAEWMGWENIFHCEWNEFGQKVLNHYWPKAISYNDITKTDFTIHRGKIDILTGGFPCQPYSMAGKRKGKEDERHLWPEMLRAIREIQPRWVVGENVFGLINWSGGLVFHEVQTDLEAEGYEVFPYVLPACAVNAPHRRDRVWFVAYSKNANASGFSEYRSNRESLNKGKREGIWSEFGNNGKSGIATDAESEQGERVRSEQREFSQQEQGKFGGCYSQMANATDSNRELREGWGGKNRSIKAERYSCSPLCNDTWQNFPTQSPICDGNDGFSSRLDSITFSKWRNESIKAGGNAVVPQVAIQIFKAIEQYEVTKIS